MYILHCNHSRTFDVYIICAQPSWKERTASERLHCFRRHCTIRDHNINYCAMYTISRTNPDLIYCTPPEQFHF